MHIDSIERLSRRVREKLAREHKLSENEVWEALVYGRLSVRRYKNFYKARGRTFAGRTLEVWFRFIESRRVKIITAYDPSRRSGRDRSPEG